MADPEWISKRADTEGNGRPAWDRISRRTARAGLFVARVAQKSDSPPLASELAWAGTMALSAHIG
jgi:hypothetical protein